MIGLLFGWRHDSLAKSNGTEEGWQNRLAFLQSVLEADRAHLVRPDREDLLFVGAVAEARRRLAALPAEAQAVREGMFGDRAAEELRRALTPPDLPALRRIGRRWAGTSSGDQAAAARTAWLLDRGWIHRAAHGPALQDLLPEAWWQSLPPPQPRASLAPPWVADANDPLLPRIGFSDLREAWRHSFEDPPWAGSFYARHRAAVAGGRVYLTDSKEVVALNAATGEVLWRFEGPPGWHRAPSSSANGRRKRADWMEGFDPETISAPVLEDGILLCTLQEPWRLGRSDAFFEIDVRRFLPGRRIYAFDANDGTLLWVQKVSWENPDARTDPEDLAAAPPAAAAGRVFLPVYRASGTLDLQMLCLDLATGQEIWRTFLVGGARETNLFGNVLRELACAPPVADGSRVIVCTNLGALCALDAIDGSALWTRLYERTSVRTFQTGEIARRVASWANQTPAFDGKTVFCAPTDSPTALWVDATNGALMAQLPRRRSAVGGGARLRHIAAASDEGAFLVGSHAGFTAWPGKSGANSFGQRLHAPSSSPAQHRQGALTRDGLLVPTPDALLLVNPQTGTTLHRLPWPQGMMDLGDLVAAPGLVLVMRQDGVVALSSPSGLLASLPSTPDEATLASLLPSLEELARNSDVTTAPRVRDACLRLAQQSQHPVTRFRLLAAAAHGARNGGLRAEAVDGFASILNSEAPVLLRDQAAWQLLDLLEPELLHHAALPQALARAEESLSAGPAWPQLRLLRSHWKWAATRKRSELEREILTRVLSDPNADRATGSQGGTLAAEAEARLQTLLRDPALRKKHETAATLALTGVGLDPIALRPWRGTQAARDHLQALVERTDLALGDRVRLVARLRDSLQTNPAWREILAGESWLQTPPRPKLPPNIRNHTTIPLLGAGLAFAATDQGFLSLEEGETWLLRFLSFDSKTLLTSCERSPYTSSQAAFADSQGAVLFADNLWIRLNKDESVQRILLPGMAASVATPIRLGGMLAYLCPDQGRLRLQVREMRSGALFLDRVLSISPDAILRLVASKQHLFILQRGEISALRFNLSENAQAEVLPLGVPPSISDLEAAVAVGPELLLPSSLGGLRLILTGDPEPQTIPMPRQALIKIFSAEDRAGWVLQPLVPGHGEVPQTRLEIWQPPAEKRTRLTLPVGPHVLPQFKSHQRLSLFLARNQLLDLAPSSGGGGVQLSIWDLENGTKQSHALPGFAWVRFISRRTPDPVAAKDGWLIPLTITHPARRTLEVTLIAQPDGGDPVFLPTLPSPTRPSDWRIQLGPAGILIADRAQIHFLGT